MKIVGRKDLAGARAAAIAIVEQKAEEWRLTQTAGWAGLSAVYRAKLEEARLYLDDLHHEPSLLVDEAQARGISVQELSEQIVLAEAEWRRMVGRIEAQRFLVKSEIGKSNCVASIRAIAENFTPHLSFKESEHG